MSQNGWCFGNCNIFALPSIVRQMSHNGWCLEIAAFFITTKMSRPPSVTKVTTDGNEKPQGGLLTDIVDGLQYIRKNRLVMILLIIIKK